ncbi:hypothetical protein EYF80_051770 [Liparis tanakae]|uniref:Uncharacterized protein n=1 Tax=Liparis tanakae TaxID=230148 RepID=A0A4Z2FB10_9TELE|nr:hypothetical protein EYF80_051770 [Liparis tanakae]
MKDILPRTPLRPGATGELDPASHLTHRCEDLIFHWIQRVLIAGQCGGEEEEEEETARGDGAEMCECLPGPLAPKTLNLPPEGLTGPSSSDGGLIRRAFRQHPLSDLQTKSRSSSPITKVRRVHLLFIARS